MKLLFENGFSFPTCVFDYAIESGKLECIKWLLEKNFVFDEDMDMFNLLISKGDLNIIKFLHENNYPFNTHSLSRAIESRNTDIVNWLLEKKFPVNESEINKI
jgi:hypothetical protein